MNNTVTDVVELDAPLQIGDDPNIRIRAADGCKCLQECFIRHFIFLQIIAQHSVIRTLLTGGHSCETIKYCHTPLR